MTLPTTPSTTLPNLNLNLNLNLTTHTNASGYITEDDHEDLGFTDMQTVGIACLATLVPLSLALLAVFGFRMAWKSWRRDGEDRSLRRTDSSDPNKSSHLLLPDEIKTSESQFSVIPVEELEEVMTSYSTISAPGGMSETHNHTRKSTANGNIITMTMKNNHLIVETEERILGISDTACIPNFTEDTPAEEDSDQTALVHHNGELHSLGQLQGRFGTNTGLSQSDLSVSSGGSANPGYCYGNQLEYLGDPGDVLPQVSVHATAILRLNPFPLTIQPSQDIEDDELYLEQQHQLGNGRDDVQTVPDLLPPTMCSNPYDNPGYVATPDQQQVNPIS